MPLQELVVYGVLGQRGEERRLAQSLLALAVARECSLDVLPAVEREAGGKPFFPAHPEICFNLSHSHGAAVCALHHLPVGVDVERLRSAPKRLAAGLEEEAFFRLWTAREATIKRRGQGLAALLRPVSPDPLCQCLPDFLPGCIVTVCPSQAAVVRKYYIQL